MHTVSDRAWSTGCRVRPYLAQISELLPSSAGIRWTHHLAAQAETLQVRLPALPLTLWLHVHMPVPRLMSCTSLHPKAKTVLQQLCMRHADLLVLRMGHRRLACLAHAHISFTHAAGWVSRRATSQRNTIPCRLHIQVLILPHAAAYWRQAESPYWVCESPNWGRGPAKSAWYCNQGALTESGTEPCRACMILRITVSSA